jgi:hypothetical protein
VSTDKRNGWRSLIGLAERWRNIVGFERFLSVVSTDKRNGRRILIGREERWRNIVGFVRFLSVESPVKCKRWRTLIRLRGDADGSTCNRRR